MYSRDQSERLRRILEFIQEAEVRDVRESERIRIPISPKEIRLLFATDKEPPPKKEEARKPFSSELIALADAFGKLGDCMRDLTDALQFLPEHLTQCMEKVMKNISNAPKEDIDVWKDPRTGRNIYILNVKKDSDSLYETEGLLEEIGRKIEQEGIDTPDLVRKAWKGG